MRLATITKHKLVLVLVCPSAYIPIAIDTMDADLHGGLAFYSRCPSCPPHLPKCGIGTEHHHIEAGDLVSQPGFEVSSVHGIWEMVSST